MLKGRAMTMRGTPLVVAPTCRFCGDPDAPAFKVGQRVLIALAICALPIFGGCTYPVKEQRTGFGSVQIQFVLDCEALIAGG